MRISIKATFNWVKSVPSHFVFALRCSVIGPENSHHSLNQSDAKLTPIETWSSALSRACGSLPVLILSSHWLLMTQTFAAIGSCNYLVLVLRQGIENCYVLKCKHKRK